MMSVALGPHWPHGACPGIYDLCRMPLLDSLVERPKDFRLVGAWILIFHHLSRQEMMEHLC